MFDDADDERGVIIISKKLLKVPELNLTEKIILGEVLNISKGADECIVTNVTLGELLGLSAKTIGNTMTALIKKEYVEIKVEYLPETGRAFRRILILLPKLKELMEEELEAVKPQNIATPEFRNEVVEPSEKANHEFGKINEIALPESGKIKSKIQKVRKIGIPQKGKYISIYNQDIIKKILSNNKIQKIANDKLLAKDNLLNNEKKISTDLSKDISSTDFDIFRILGKTEYSRIKRWTRRNIMKNFPNITEEHFAYVFNRIVEQEKMGLITEFDAALYLGLKNQWKSIGSVTTPKSKKIEDKEKIGSKTDIPMEKKEIVEPIEIKSRWFKSCFRGIKIEEYLELLERIPFEILVKNRSRLGKLSPYDFKTEFRKLLSPQMGRL